MAGRSKPKFDEKADFEVMKKKRAVVISARVHPGETNASWMVQGLMDTLLNPKEEDEELEVFFVFENADV